MDIFEKADNVRTRGDLVSFIYALLEEFRERRGEWENPTLESYLDALAAVVDGLDARFANQGLQLPAEPTWQLVADILLTARTYE
jgi:hypothetical protein